MSEGRDTTEGIFLDEMLRDLQPICPLCRNIISGGGVSCPRCETKVHDDCKMYNPGCPTMYCDASPRRRQQELAQDQRMPSQDQSPSYAGALIACMTLGALALYSDWPFEVILRPPIPFMYDARSVDTQRLERYSAESLRFDSVFASAMRK